jgi:hypothetical protein
MHESAKPAEEIIKDLIHGNNKGSNDNQFRGVELLRGLAGSDEELANQFMNKLSEKYADVAKELGVQ